MKTKTTAVKIKTAGLRAAGEQLIRDGKMPGLHEVLGANAEGREEYQAEVPEAKRLSHIPEFESSGSSPGYAQTQKRPEGVNLNSPIVAMPEALLASKNGARINYWYERRIERPIEFQEEVKKYIEAVVGSLMKNNLVHFDHEDLVQDAWLKVYKKLDSFRGKSKFSSWIYAVTRNVFLDEVRRISRRKDTYSVEPGEDKSIASVISFEDPSSSEDASNLQLDFQSFKRNLSAEQRQILEGRLDGEKPAETARRLGLKVKRVNYQMQVLKKSAFQLLNRSSQGSSRSRKTVATSAGKRRLYDFISNRDHIERLSGKPAAPIPEEADGIDRGPQTQIGNPGGLERLSGYSEGKPISVKAQALISNLAVST